MAYIPPVSSPNIDKLFLYLKRSQWHNVSANFSGYVRKEYESHLDKLGEDDDILYSNLKLMIEFSEMGKFSEAKNLVDRAHKEYQKLISSLTDLSHQRHTHRGVAPNQDNYTRRETYTPDKREIATPSKRDRNQENYTRRETYTPDKREVASPSKRDRDQHQGRPQGNTGYETPQREHNTIVLKEEQADRTPPRTPQYQNGQPQQYDRHRENYESLRLKSPEKQPNTYMPEHSSPPRHTTPSEHGSRPNSYHHGQDQRAVQMASSKALWGRDHGDKPSEKVGSSTYRHDFPTYPVDSHERKDKERYRENFGSLAERDLYRGTEDGSYSEEQRRAGPISRHSETPDHDNRPSELAKKFRELYNHEWTDAYDEICKDFGSEKTVRHLLWIVTEAYLIANDVADHQLRGLEHQAFDVMTSPTDNHEAWLIAGDVAYKQLSDLEKAAVGLMSAPSKERLLSPPSQEHRGGYSSRHLGDNLPASRSLLMRYRKQTAVLSIPYVKEECRDKISKTLMESSGFPKSYLSDASRLTAYINKCAELTWLMCVQDPPIVLEYITRETEGARFNHDHYQTYTKSGSTFDYGVWPMLRLGKGGTILSKGIAQGI